MKRASVNRALLYALLVALVFVRALPLHGHWHAHADHLPAAVADADHAHFVHTHIVDAHADGDHDAATVEIDLFGSALARDIATTATQALINTAFVLLLVVLWICLGRTTLPRFRAPILPLLPWRPSPRAPPR